MRPRRTDSTPTEYFQQTRGEMLEFLGDLPVGAILDVGCGDASFGAFVRERKNAEVWGVELDEEVAEKAKGRIDRFSFSRTSKSGL